MTKGSARLWEWTCLNWTILSRRDLLERLKAADASGVASLLRTRQEEGS